VLLQGFWPFSCPPLPFHTYGGVYTYAVRMQWLCSLYA